ncbi:effector-associated domain EAD1-containing protein [uncultured Zhongshania sp.]|uniref:Effector-associated domain EAD1-containing protein n=1 Tax=Zhongshania guokunii TaxID=641783 RepID=A0ABV3U908_9GAMM|nr:effector-associated domain EAD1-containing protein [uncultured Zhongshania sp.]
MNKPILILTALEVERLAIEHHLNNFEPILHPETGTDYTKGTYTANERILNVIVGRTDQTNINAAIETERAIAHFKPEYVFFAGVAGGLKDVKVGDIIIGRDVYGYERGKAEENNFKPRPQFGASSYALERLAGQYAKSTDWNKTIENLLNSEFAPVISTYTGTIVSGEKVDASIGSDLHQFLKQNASHALGIEMEGLGFLEVCRMRPLVKTLLLRGISDLVDGKDHMDGKGSQSYASANVAAFLFGLLEQLDFSDATTQPTREQKLVEIMCKLYPGGLRDNQIWITAGGDLSLINLGQSGKGQWVEAIRTLKLGGGGNVDIDSLIETVAEEYGNNKDVKEIL